jgi:hypothetical protein
MLRPVLALALLATGGTALAQQAATGQAPSRIRDVTIKPGEPCPKASGDEVVVCRTLDEPYRIPKTLRDEHPIAAANQSWVNRTATADQIGRVAGGLPNTCSPVGTGGQTGCFQQRAQAYAADKRASRSAEASVPGGE